MGTFFVAGGILLLDFCAEMTYDREDNTWHFVKPDSLIFYGTALLSLIVGGLTLSVSYPEIAATETFVNNALQFVTYGIFVVTFLLTIANITYLALGFVRYLNKVRKSVVNG